LSNDSESYQAIREIALEQPSPYDAGLAIREYVEICNPLAEEHSLYADLLLGAIEIVNWQEIANAFLEE
jgi:hypothetical protein